MGSVTAAVGASLEYLKDQAEKRLSNRKSIYGLLKVYTDLMAYHHLHCSLKIYNEELLNFSFQVVRYSTIQPRLYSIKNEQLSLPFLHCYLVCKPSVVYLETLETKAELRDSIHQFTSLRRKQTISHLGLIQQKVHRVSTRNIM